MGQIIISYQIFWLSSLPHYNEPRQRPSESFDTRKMGIDWVKPSFTTSSPNPPLNNLHVAITELAFLPTWREEEEAEEGRKKRRDRGKIVLRFLDAGSPKRVPHRFQGPSCIPEHFPSPLFANYMVAPYWLASRSFLRPIRASPPTHCLMRELYKNCQNPIQTL